MAQNFGKAREQAETAFGKTQSQFMARDRILSEQDALVQARDEKTARLRELRMAKEASATPATATPKRSAKRKS
nr:hypothetical protein [uncultured Gellertiella sp.]